MDLITYVGIGLVFWALDGAICYAAQRKFRVWPSLVCSVVWPLWSVLVVIGATVRTKDFKKIGE